jgi:hypothetical protein
MGQFTAPNEFCGELKVPRPGDDSLEIRRVGSENGAFCLHVPKHKVEET